MSFAQLATATPTQMRLYQERKARLARLGTAALLPKPKRVEPFPAPRPQTPFVSGWFPYYRAAPYDSWDCAVPVPVRDWKAITQEVCRKHGITFQQIVGPLRSVRIVKARHEAFFRLREERQLAWPAIGRFFGDRDHTTVIHGYRKHAKRMEAMQ